jgi:hypothetical protein
MKQLTRLQQDADALGIQEMYASTQYDTIKEMIDACDLNTLQNLKKHIAKSIIRLSTNYKGIHEGVVSSSKQMKKHADAGNSSV